VPDLLSALTRRGWASAPRAARLVPHTCMHMEQMLALSCSSIVCAPRIRAPATDSSRQSMDHATALACLLDPRVDRAPQRFACVVSRPCTASWSGCSQPHLCLTCLLGCCCLTADFSVFVGDLAPDVTDFVLQEAFRVYYPSVRSAKVRAQCQAAGCSC
jgi:hypothetical protein